jgi:hypothetical protein
MSYVAMSQLERVLDGGDPEGGAGVDECIGCLREKLLPFFEAEEALAVLPCLVLKSQKFNYALLQLATKSTT